MPNTQGSLPFDDPSISVTIKRIKSGKFTMPLDLDDSVQDLIRRLLTVEVTKRITIGQIKSHPAFRIGLPEGYTLPTPLPLPRLDDPMHVLPENQSAFKIIKRIGFENLTALLEEETTNMAKVFFHMMTQPFDPESLPWDSSSNVEFEHPFLSPLDESPLFPHHFDIEQSSSPSGSPFAIPDLNILQDGIRSNSPLFVQEHEIPNIGLDIYALMAKLQWFLSDKFLQWFHPCDRSLIVRNARLNTFMSMSASYDEANEKRLSLSVEMEKGTQEYFEEFCGEVSALLSGDIVNEDEQMNEANSFSYDIKEDGSHKYQCCIF